jgi:hypothetical protein
MAFVRTRGTTTALIEAYRDERGRPRQRLLANLHGEPDALSALAKLAVRRDDLRKERDTLTADAVDANKFYEIVTLNSLQGKQYSATERKEINTLLRQRERLMARIARVESDLATIQKDGAVIKKHCSATPDEVQAAIRAFKEKFHEAEMMSLGMEFGLREQLKEVKAKLRRLSA